ncbi:DUF6782 family putative metallopeptidase [uncultured Aliiroseovarius sp.]|uniref:DUF6782 family putative metallopeptidase n=1 Tax=uncultured Aliiroseovarius sp. TaxID=1658783 RepID=UPI00261C1798|nr:DUF6782 family putative metallopeptidase [uncultured Aliiroseovarius sp.]
MRFLVAPLLAALPTLCSGQTSVPPTTSCLVPATEPATSADQEQISQLHAAIAPVLDTVFRGLDASPDKMPKICLTDFAHTSLGEYVGAEHTIVLQRDMPNALKQGILLHELRHADQFRRGFCPSNDISMEANARAVAAMEADASAISLLAAWELSAMGHPLTWEALSSWSMQSDIADRFAQEMKATGNTTVAVTKAFAQWYDLDLRWRSYYVASCSDFLDRQDETHLLPSYKSLPQSFLNDLCVLSDGARYPCDDANGHARSR